MNVRRIAACLMTALLPSACGFAQTTLKAEAESAIVWSGPQCKQSDTTLGGHDPLCDGAPSTHPEASSLVQDPLSGNYLREISWQGIDVISGLRSRDLGCGWSQCHTEYVATFTIVNNTAHPLTLDGKTFASTLPLPTAKEIRKWWGKKVNPADFVPASETIQPGQSARVSGVMVGSGNASNITRWFNNTPFLVTPVRYSIQLRGKDFVFPWLAPLNINFGEVPQWDY